MVRKNIIITSGPTNEPLDQVMQITNMSTGKLGAAIADYFLSVRPEQVSTLYYVCHKRAVRPSSEDPRLETVAVQATDEMLEAIRGICTHTQVDIIVHSAAVGDYKGRYVARMEDIAHEIHRAMDNGIKKEGIAVPPSEKDILDILRHPSCVCDRSTKISSQEPNLICGLGLTEKIIRHLRPLAPDAKIAACKLLDDVPYEMLIKAAYNLMASNGLDYVIANDLSQVSGNTHMATMVTRNGTERALHTKNEIAAVLVDRMLP